MTILLAAILASAQPLPYINRAELHALAKIEALQARSSVRAPTKLRLIGNMQMIAAVCGAAGKLEDPAGFLGEIGSAYSMSRGEVAALRETCAVYLSGRLDAQRASLVTTR